MLSCTVLALPKINVDLKIDVFMLPHSCKIELPLL